MSATPLPIPPSKSPLHLLIAAGAMMVSTTNQWVDPDFDDIHDEITAEGLDYMHQTGDTRRIYA